jgi:hypothetical protein
MDKYFTNIEACSDKEYLYKNLNTESLNLIEDILEAYNSDKIDFITPRYENGEPDFYGDFKLVVNDESYIENGTELLVLKWYEDYEDTGYLVECFK